MAQDPMGPNARRVVAEIQKLKPGASGLIRTSEQEGEVDLVFADSVDRSAIEALVSEVIERFGRTAPKVTILFERFSRTD